VRRLGWLGQLLLLVVLARGAATHDVSNGGAEGMILVGIGFGILTVPRTTLETDDESTGWRGLAGYRFNRYFAAEPDPVGQASA